MILITYARDLCRILNTRLWIFRIIAFILAGLSVAELRRSYTDYIVNKVLVVGNWKTVAVRREH